jgi:2-polyprenyl-3-methyl-5-hydroxy-6-metoxy-1,4-benzoquinol methylase
MSTSALDEVVLNFVLGRKILDVGCGLGRWGHLIRVHLQIKGIEPEIIGIDMRKEWLYKGRYI